MTKTQTRLFLKAASLFVKDNTFTDTDLCNAFNLAIPTTFSSDRVAATKALVNFQAKKAYLVASINKQLAPMKVQVSQVSHTSYLVIPSSAKKARMRAQVSRLQATIKGL